MTPTDFLIQFEIDSYGNEFNRTGIVKSLDVGSDDFKKIVTALKEYAILMCEKQKQICADVGKGCKYGFYEELALDAPLPNELL